MILDKLLELKRIFVLMFQPTYFGFINGLSYLKKNEFKQMHSLVLNQDSNEQITKLFEQEFSKIIGDGKAISFAAGRMAFYSYMKILEIGLGDEVILQASNCAVMVNAVLRIGAIPVFADIDINTMGSDPNSVKKLITSKTRLIVAQHSFGIPCEIDKIIEIARESGIKVIEDCALTVGSKYKGIMTGNWGDAALYSIDHSKPINCMVGGLLYLKDDNLYKKILKYRDDLPNLNKKHQLALLKQILFEKKYFNPQNYALGKLLIIITVLIDRIKKPNIVFLTDEFEHPDKNHLTNYPYPAKLPAFIAQLGLYELKQFQLNKENRIQLLNKYLETFKQNDKLSLLPNAYFDEKREIVPLRVLAYLPNISYAVKHFKNTFEVNSSWFQKPIIACKNPEDLGYTYGSCVNSEFTSQKIINFPCTYDPIYRDKLIEQLNNFLSSRSL